MDASVSQNENTGRLGAAVGPLAARWRGAELPVPSARSERSWPERRSGTFRTVRIGGPPRHPQ